MISVDARRLQPDLGNHCCKIYGAAKAAAVPGWKTLLHTHDDGVASGAVGSKNPQPSPFIDVSQPAFLRLSCQTNAQETALRRGLPGRLSAHSVHPRTI